MHRPSCIHRGLSKKTHKPYPEYEPPCEVSEMSTHNMINWIEDVEILMRLNGELKDAELYQEWEAYIQHRAAQAWRQKRKISPAIINTNISPVITKDSTVITPNTESTVSKI
jgi:hypothetical protein